MQPGADDPGRREWPLVLFTLGVQLACGLVLASLAMNWFLEPLSPSSARPLGVLVFPAVVAASLSSLLHLGRPRDAWKSLSNLATSRLSQEVAFTSLFGVAALCYSAVWLAGTQSSWPALGWGTALLAVAAVTVGALIYVVPSRPVWNSWWVPASFLATVLLMTGVLGATAATIDGATRVVSTMAGAVLVGAALQTLAARRMIALATAVARRDSEVLGVDQMVRVRRPQVRWALRLHFALAVAIPALLAASCFVSGLGAASGAWILAATSVLAGSLLGRRLMFTLGAAAPRF